MIEQIRIPRWYGMSYKHLIKLHIFIDAGAVVYMRSVDEGNFIKVILIDAKSKVAPFKALSLPRIELRS